MGKEEQKEVAVYTAENPAIAQMLVEKLSDLGIPARVGSESVSAGLGSSVGGRTILVLKESEEKAKEVLEIE
jgi:hypothetical protein